MTDQKTQKYSTDTAQVQKHAVLSDEELVGWGKQWEFRWSWCIRLGVVEKESVRKVGSPSGMLERSLQRSRAKRSPSGRTFSPSGVKRSLSGLLGSPSGM